MATKKAHFIGIAGKGMSATALLLRQQGWEITGSDEGFYPPVSDYLKDAKIPFAQGYKKENIPVDTDLIVIGKHAKLVPETNEEVRAAFESGKPCKSFPQVIEELTEKTDNIVVAGSYGKSTCTALLSWCLEKAGKDPSYFIGEVTKGFDTYAHIGVGNTFVLEGDEYPTANWDMSPKFLHYHPRSVLFTSATHDHVNIYPTHADYMQPFEALMELVPREGLVVVNADEQFAMGIAEKYAGKKVFYSMSVGPLWHPRNIKYGIPTTFDLYQGDKSIVTISLSLLGAHNIENIVAVSAMLLEKNLLTPQELERGIASFEGVKRRMELLSPKSSVPVYEGFGSSYEKAKAAMAAMKLHFPNNRLVVVFEPHTFSWRNRDAILWYDDVFTGAEKIFIYEPPSHGANEKQLSQSEIVERVKSAGFAAEAITEPAAALESIKKDLRKDDVVLLLTSGDMGGLLKSIPAMAETEFPA